jgi:hypothetical protein
LKKKIHIIVFLPILALLSCGQNSHEKELNGKWYGLENDGFTRMFFYPDSLVITELGSPQNIEWTANESVIEFDYHMRFDSLENTFNKHKIDYTLSESRDTLFGKIKDSTEERSFSLIKAQNYLNFLSKKSDVKFELPSNNNIEHFDQSGKYGFKLFAGFKNKVFNIITEYGNGLDSIEADILKFKQKINPQGQYEKSKMYHGFHFRIFADKSITNEQLKGHIQVLDSIKMNGIFRIYKSEEYRNLGYLRGERIKTIANKGYSK